MSCSSICLLLTMTLAFPAPREPDPDDKGRGFFGVQLIDNGGVLVMRVEPGSPAEKAGIAANDLIQAIDAASIGNVDDARECIGRLRPGTVTHVEVLRGARKVSIKVKVGLRPDSLP